MRLTIDLDSGNLVYSAKDLRRVTSVSFKRGDSANVEIQFVQDGAVVELSGTTITGSIGFKEDGKYDTASCVVGPASWTKSGSGTSTLYTATPNFNTAALNTLLAADDGDDTNDVASVTLMGEISWTIDGDVYSSNEFDAVVANDVLKGGEASPTALEDAAEAWLQSNGILYRSDITGYTGGTATDLDSIATAALAVPQTVMVKIGGFIHLYTLEAGTAATSVPGTIQPTDHAASTNEKVWTLRGMLLNGLTVRGVLNAVNATDVNIGPDVLDVQGPWRQNSGTDPDFWATIRALNLTADRTIDWPNADCSITGIIYGSSDPASAPASSGLFYRNTTTNQLFFSVDDTGTDDWVPVGASYAPASVADAAARKNVSTYSGGALYNGLQVIQDDLADVLWTLVDSTDVTADASWIGLPMTNSDGELVGPLQVSVYTPTSSASVVPASGEILAASEEDFSVNSFDFSLPGYIQIGDGSSRCDELPAIGMDHRPMKYVSLDIDSASDLGGSSNKYPLDPRFNYTFLLSGTYTGDVSFSGSVGLGQRLRFIGYGNTGTMTVDNQLGLGTVTANFVGGSGGGSEEAEITDNDVLEVEVIPNLQSGSGKFDLLITYESGVTYYAP